MTNFSKRMETAEPSMVRELWKYWYLPDLHSLGGGNPAPETFPVKEMQQISEELFKESKGDNKKITKLFSYGVTEGEDELREVLRSRYMEHYGIGDPEKDELAVFTGGQQIIDLTVKAFVNTGDAIAVEDSTYSGLMSCAWGYEAKMTGVRTDKDGMIPEELEKVLKENDRVKLIYLVPTFNNPMGIVTSLERRKAIYELAVRYDVMILEDSPYFELRYSGEYVPAIKSLDTTGHVIFAGSTSKILAPGMRLGFAIADKNVMGKLVIGKQCEDLNNPGLLQLMVARYIKTYDLDAHIRDNCDLYRRKRDAMLAALDKYMAGKAEWTHPEGGFFLWLTLPEGVSGDDFCHYVIEKYHVLVVCGSAYRPNGDDVNALRLNFSLPEVDEIDLCIKRISDALEAYQKEQQ